MLFTTKTEYGLRAMVALARGDRSTPLPLSIISKQEKVSLAYLERIFSKLKADDLVTSTKGAGGGYALSRPASKINIFEIVEALEGPLAVFYCMATTNKTAMCSTKKCLTKKVWHELQKNVIKTLRGFTLSELV